MPARTISTAPFLDSKTELLRRSFYGLHAYVSASTYTTRENVPNLNYGAVHVLVEQPAYFRSLQKICSGVLHQLID